MNKNEFVIITGLSGAGKSLAMKYLEDFGYFCADNIPYSFLINFADMLDNPDWSVNKMAMGVDVRSGSNFSKIDITLQQLKDKGIDYKIIYLEADNKTLLKRYSESRRTHPLAENFGNAHGISRERDLIKDIKAKADVIIDTSTIKPIQLKELLRTNLFDDAVVENMIVIVKSFGFKNGYDINADLLFDVRFLPNPHYIEELRPLTGRDKAVYDYVMNNEVSKEFIKKLKDMLDFLLPKYIQEGKSQLTLAIGCTGGKHRSVAIAILLHKWLKEKNILTIIEHRDS